MVKVSVIVPVYNEERYLEKCMESICSQTLQEIEIICVDDGSTDGSLYILESFAENDSRIKVLAQENLFAGAARNYGMQYASGQYLAFLDADDYFKEDMLEKMYQAAESGCSDIVICRYREHCERTGKLRDMDWAYADYFLEGRSEFTGALLKYAGIFQAAKGWAWDKLFKTSFVKQCGYSFPEFRSSEDGFFVYMLLTRAGKIFYMKDTFVVHRVNDSRSLSNTLDKNWMNGFKMLLLIQEEMKRLDIYKIYQQSFLNESVRFFLWYLQSMRSFETFKNCCQYIQKVMEVEMGILDYGKEYYFRKELYDWYHKIAVLPAEEYLFQEQKKNDTLIKQQSEIINQQAAAYKALEEKLSERGWVFPFHSLEKNKTVVLYGAGKLGKCYYSQLIDSRFCKQVIWVDRHFESYRGAGEPVDSPEIISDVGFDYVFIAVKDQKMQTQIKDWLLGKGVQFKKIHFYGEV